MFSKGIEKQHQAVANGLSKKPHPPSSQSMIKYQDGLPTKIIRKVYMPFWHSTSSFEGILYFF